MMRIHTGLGHTENESAQHFWLRKPQCFSCAANGVRTLGHLNLSPTLYQLSHPVTYVLWTAGCQQFGVRVGAWAVIKKKKGSWSIMLFLIGIIIIYCWLIAQSPARGRLRAFSQVKFRTQIEYNTKHAYDIHVKHTNIIRKVVPSVSLSLKNGK